MGVSPIGVSPIGGSPNGGSPIGGSPIGGSPIDPSVQTGLVQLGVVQLGVVQLGSVQMGVDHHLDRTVGLTSFGPNGGSPKLRTSSQISENHKCAILMKLSKLNKNKVSILYD